MSIAVRMITALGRTVLCAVTRLGEMTIFLRQTLCALPALRRIPVILLQQVYDVGVLSLPIIVLSGVFVGCVLGLQSYHVLVHFGAEESVGVLTALSLLLELGPVITALLFIGRACSSLTAEIGLMRATEQIDGLSMLGIDPMARLIAPRFVAAVLCAPMLTVLFTVVGIYGSFVVASPILGIDAGIYWGKIQAAVDWHGDVLEGIGKSIIFALIYVWITLYNGYYAAPTAIGVSRATTATVVWSSVTVFAADAVITALLFRM